MGYGRDEAKNLTRNLKVEDEISRTPERREQEGGWIGNSFFPFFIHYLLVGTFLVLAVAFIIG